MNEAHLKAEILAWPDLVMYTVGQSIHWWHLKGYLGACNALVLRRTISGAGDDYWTVDMPMSFTGLDISIYTHALHIHQMVEDMTAAANKLRLWTKTT